MLQTDSRRRAVLLVFAVFAVRFALCVLWGTGPGDESWFLRVVDRVVHGEVLYRDVFFGATPLAVQVAAAAARIGGVEAIVVKAVWAAASAATVLVCVRIARRFGVATATWLVALPFLVYPLPNSNQLHGTLSLLFQLVALDATLAAADAAGRRRTIACVVAGAAAGLAFATKPNVGVFTIAGVVAGLALTAPTGGAAAWLRGAAISGAAFVAAAAVPLLPVVLGGSWTSFADYVFLNKVTYVRVAGESWFRQAGARLPWDATSAADLAWRLVNLPVLFTFPAAFVLLAAAAWRAAAADRRRLAALGVFLAAGAAFVYPRANLRHLSLPMATAVLACWIAWSRLAPALTQRMRRAVRLAATAFLVASVMWLAGPHVRDLARGRERISDLPHFAGVVTKSADIESAREIGAVLAEEARAGRRPFVCGQDSGFWQLVSGIPNPTPIDYAFSTSMGRTGERDTIAAIVAGRIGVVWLDPSTQAELRPAALEEYVRTHLVRDGSVGGYEVWRERR